MKGIPPESSRSDVNNGSMNERLILQSWKSNAAAWIDAVQHTGIRAPGALTREAIMAAVSDYAPNECAILDVGCGEGWLTHALSREGHRVTGVDPIPDLIQHAKSHLTGDFVIGDQSRLLENDLGRFDLVVCNFALFGDQTVKAFFDSLSELLTHGGLCIVQTLHPWAYFNDGQYRSQWVDGTWAGLAGKFEDAPPWFFRTLENWCRLFSDSGLVLNELREPKASDELPKSIIFIATKKI